MAGNPKSKRWIWITVTVVAVLGLLSWLYLRDDPPEPDDDLIRDRTTYAEEENGFTLVMGLGDDVGFEAEDEDWVRDFLSGRVRWDGARAERLLEAEGPALEILGKLKDKRVIAEALVESMISDPGGGRYVPGVSFLGKVNALAMVQAAMAGDRTDFLEHLATGIRLAEQVERGRQSILDILVGMVVRTDVLRGVAALAESPLFADEDCRVHGLSLLDDWDGEALWRDGMRDEYRIFRNTLIALKGGGHSEAVSGLAPSGDDGGWVFSLIRLKVNRSSKLAADHIRALTAVKGKTLKEYNDRLPVLDKPHPLRILVSPNGTGEMLVAIAMPVTSGVIRNVIRLRARLEMIRTLLALRDFQEANGHLPDTLNDLVPTFLKGVPVDRMDGMPLRYDPARAVLWSVGRNLEDDGGIPQLNEDDCLRIWWAEPEGGLGVE